MSLTASLFELTEEQRLLQDTIRKFARETVAPRAQEIDASAEYPQDMFEALKKLQMFALPFPDTYGGANSILMSCIAVEELGKICYNTAYLLIVQWVPFGAILKAGNDAQKARFLPGLASGELRSAIAVTEAGGGSDVAGITTRAERTDGGYILNGSKVFSTNSAISDFVIVAAKTDPTKRHAGISVFIVEKGTPGFTVGPSEKKIGSRGVPSSPLYFDNCFIPEELMLGEEGKGFQVVTEAFSRSRPIIGARGVGLAQGALDLSLAYVKERQAFGQSVADFQGIQWMLADMATQTEAARLLVYKAAAAVDGGLSGKALAPVAAMAKYYATDVAMKVATDAFQLFGSAGVSTDNRIEQYFRDAKVLQIIEGTNQIQRNIIGKHLVKN
ncbi:MAG: acyl-CoA dehydrogenase family protein [Pseudomonadales bacterium]|nr:acyl-CoA dehydrogenase family protein [Pseudomonadales bacterium]